MASSIGIEPTTYSLGGSRSILLSYEDTSTLYHVFYFVSNLFSNYFACLYILDRFVKGIWRNYEVILGSEAVMKKRKKTYFLLSDIKNLNIVLYIINESFMTLKCEPEFLSM